VATTLLVEGPKDATIVWILLDRARMPLDDLTIMPCGGRQEVVRRAHAAGHTAEKVAVLVDADAWPASEAVAALQVEIANPAITGFVAVPNTEAWVLGNPDLARELAHTRELWPALSTSPELDVLASSVPIDRAAAADPSLRRFLSGMAGLLGQRADRWVETPGRHISREIVANLLREVSPTEVVWRMSDGSVLTADQLVRELEAGTDLGRQYASDLLRVARDFIRRKSQRPSR
jgi:hypothetical protein